MSCFKRKRAVTKGECGTSPQGLKRHSSNKPANIGIKSATNEGVTGDDMAKQKDPTHMAVWEKLVGRANEESIFINGQPVTALLDTWEPGDHVSHDYCVANGIEINPIAKLVNIESTGGDSIEYLGYVEASLSLPIGSHTFNIDALLLVLPTTEYLKKVPVSMGTTITDMVVDFINQHKPDNMSKSWKVVCCATHTRKLVQAQPNSKRAIKTTKLVTLPPFSTTVVKGNTKFKSHGRRLNLIAESPNGTQLPSGIQCTPTYCTMEPGSSRVSVGLRNILKHDIKITHPQPFKERYRRIPPHLYEEVKAHLQEMVEVGAIRRRFSPWASAVVLVRKKDGGLRFCIDLCKLNNRTVKDGYSLPHIEDTLDCLHGAVWFSTLDPKSGYWQVVLEEEAKPLTAFTMGPLGFWECEHMPFGLTNAPATFQRLMESCLGELHLNWCIIYLDDIIVFSRTPEEHVHRLKAVISKLRAAGLKLKPTRCDLFKQQINYLGHVVSKEGVSIDPDKITAVTE